MKSQKFFVFWLIFIWNFCDGFGNDPCTNLEDLLGDHDFEENQIIDDYSMQILRRFGSEEEALIGTKMIEMLLSY